MRNKVIKPAPLSPARGKGGLLLRLVCAALLLALAVCAGCIEKDEKPAPAPEETEEIMGSTVFFGDSITFMGDWQGYFPEREVYNLGVSGDTIEMLEDRIGQVYKAEPGRLFVMVGINDLLSGFTVDETIREFEKLLDMLPECRVYVQSLLPVDAWFGDRAELVAEYNARLRALCEERGLTYIDLYPLYDDGTGHLGSEYTRDGLHLRPTAYEKWVDVIRGYVEG